MWSYNHTDELYHYGIKGQKWGVRRFQKPNGSYTAAGYKRKQTSESAKNATYNDALKEYDNHEKLIRNYIRIPGWKNNKQNVKRLEESGRKLEAKLGSYLRSLDDDKAKKLIEFDDEHGKYFVRNNIFDKAIDYDDWTYISNETAGYYGFKTYD